jgi:hypothetical protein
MEIGQLLFVAVFLPALMWLPRGRGARLTPRKGDACRDHPYSMVVAPDSSARNARIVFILGFGRETS